MGSVFTCKLNPCCGDRHNCNPPRQYYEDQPATISQPKAPAVRTCGAAIDLTDDMVVRAMEHIPGCDHDAMVSALEAALNLPSSA